MCRSVTPGSLRHSSGLCGPVVTNSVLCPTKAPATKVPCPVVTTVPRTIVAVLLKLIVLELPVFQSMVNVPVIGEVDETLRRFVRDEALRGSDLEVACAAPTKEWAARRNAPTSPGNSVSAELRETPRATSG